MTLLVAALVYLAFEAVAFHRGSRGELRGALIAVSAAALALALRAPTPRPAVLVGSLVVGLSLLELGVLLLHSPGASVFGLTPGNPGDFDINYSGAVEVYRYGGSPYGIERKYQLDNPSVSFPFPTFAIFWLSAGLGRWGEALAGVTLTAVNVVAALGLIWTSLRLSGVPFRKLNPSVCPPLFFAVVFLSLSSPLWLAVLEGQTPVLASCLLLFGLWFARKPEWLAQTAAAALLALGVMIKPNYAVVLLYFPIAFLRARAYRAGPDLWWRYLRIPLLAIGFFVLFVGISLIIPHGMDARVYAEFVRQTGPVLEGEARGDRRNIGLFGLMNALLPTPLPPMPALIVQTGAVIAYGLWGRPASWMVWLVIPLLISPITWTFYLGLALPLQFAIAYTCVKRRRLNDLGLLVVVTALLWAPRSVVFLGAITLILLFFLALRLEPEELVSTACDGPLH